MCIAIECVFFQKLCAAQKSDAQSSIMDTNTKYRWLYQTNEKFIRESTNQFESKTMENIVIGGKGGNDGTSVR